MVNVSEARSVPELLRHHASSAPDREALRYLRDTTGTDGTPLTYREVDRAAAAVARRLSRSFEAGDRLLLLHSFGPDFIVGFLACLYAGMVAVPAPLPGRYRHERRRVLSIAHDSGAVAVLTDDASSAEVGEWMREEGLDGLPLIATDWSAEEPGAFTPAADLGRETLAMLQYTSGSTGEPKGVMVTHGNLLRNVTALSRAFGLDEHTHFGGWIPHFHDMGLIGLLLPSLFLRSRCVLMSPSAFIRRPHTWLKMIDDFDVAWSAAPDFAYELCCRRVTDEQLGSLDLSRWRYAGNGSEPIHAGTITAFAERFAAAGFRAESLSPCYGLAESTVYVSGGPSARITAVDAQSLEDHRLGEAVPGRPHRSLVSCGAPADVDLRIVDPRTGDPLPDGAVGEIWLRGGSVAVGYWDNPAASAETFGAVIDGVEGRYLRTGDLGALYDGELYVTGRIKEMITVHGRNVYPQDVEQELRAAHQELAGCVGAVFALSDTGPDPVLVVSHEVRAGLGADVLEALARDMKQTVAREMGMTASCVVLLRRGTVRRTTSGKIQRDAMRKLFRDGELKPLHTHWHMPRQRAAVHGSSSAQSLAEESTV
ncbi:fatty acyl-AMP ligase [Streptomyces viridosporus]|uniref:fatty acyl-AMP ligase n=1 Tax=Streptomyces viridosporus TaxID=67581 RepID=UPI00003E4903|nr:fatty acyl-AMP ligase [Streptomyces viridosporus]